MPGSLTPCCPRQQNPVVGAHGAASKPAPFKPAVKVRESSVPPLVSADVSPSPAQTASGADAAKRVRDERMEALVRDRDAAVQKAKTAEAECARWRASSEAASELQRQVDALQTTIRSLEAQQFEARVYASTMARVTSTLELERAQLETQLRAAVSRHPESELHGAVDQLRAELTQLRRRYDADVGAQLARVAQLEADKAALVAAQQQECIRYQDKIDAEAALNAGLAGECAQLRGAMGSGLDELRMKLETGLQLALGRVDQLESALWLERGKSAKFLALLKQLVDEEDLEVLLLDEDKESTTTTSGAEDMADDDDVDADNAADNAAED